MRFSAFRKTLKKTTGSQKEQVGRDLRTIVQYLDPNRSKFNNRWSAQGLCSPENTLFTTTLEEHLSLHTIFRLLWAFLGLILVERAMAWWAEACCLPGASFAPGGHEAGSGTPAQLYAQVTPVSFTSGPRGARKVSHSKSCLWATGKRFVCVTIYQSILRPCKRSTNHMAWH